MKTFLLLATFASLATAGCIAVSSSQIAAGDFAGAVAQFGALDPATPIGFAPLPGVQRIFNRRQLVLILQQYGLGGPSDIAIPDVCVERAVAPITSTQMKAALIAALDVAGADIELIDFSRQPLPAGRLEFGRDNLAKPPEAAPNAPVIWRGRLLYDERHSASVWAEVRISVESTCLVAVEDISAGVPIRAGQVRAAVERRFPDWGASPSSPQTVIGKVARRSLPAGQRIVAAMLDDPADVRRGEKIHVSVTQGGTHLSLDAIAQSAGKKGDTILVHNPLSGRNFRAVVTDRGEAVAEPPGA